MQVCKTSCVVCVCVYVCVSKAWQPTLYLLFIITAKL